MTTVTGTSTSLDESFILTSTGDYRGGQGADTYILTNQIPASAIITITDKEGLNKIQLADGLVIASSKFLSNAAELTLSNGAIVRILGASSFTFDIGANTTTGDIATNPNSTYADFAKALGAQVGSTTGTPNFLVPVTIPTFSIVAGDTFSTIAAGNVSGFSASGVSEGSNATFTVKLSAAQTAAATVNYSLSGKGTTTIGNDTGTVAVQGTGVTATGGTLTFAAGITTATISVPVTFDTLLESGEGIDLTLSSPSSGVLLGTDFIASKDFLDSTAPTFSMSSSAVSGIHTLEGSTITFTITPDAVLTRDITLRLDLVGAVKNGTVPADFQIAAPELIFNTGNSLLKTITVNVANDISMEGVENYTAVLVDTKTGIQKAPSIIGTINDSANVTGPVFIGAEMDTAGTSIDLIYNQALGKAATETTSPFAFVIKVGTNIVTPSSVTVVGSRVKLNLADAITKGINDVTIDYLSPTASALTSNPAIQDILGNDAFSIVKFPVKNNSIVDSLASKLTLAMDSNFNGSSTASTVSLKANSPISTIFNATSATGIKQIIIDGTKAEVAVNNLATLATVELYNQPFGNLSVAYAAASPVVTNASDVQRLTVSNVGSTDSVAVAIDKVESLILVSTNYPNKVGLSGVTSATTIAVEGDKALTITTVPLVLNNFNAAAATASINANLSAATKLLSVQGGAGADTITVDATKLDPSALISGNGSADTLFINSGATTTATPLQPRMSTVETLKIGAITGDLVFKGDKTTDLTNLSLASTLGANVNLENLTTSNFTVNTYGVTAAAKTVTVTNIGTETLNYIAESTSFDNKNNTIFNFNNASALTVNVGKNVAQLGAITANKAVSITLNVVSSITSDNPTELTSFAGPLNVPTASSLNVNATGTLVPGSATLDLTSSILTNVKTLIITGGGNLSMTAAQYNGLSTITAAGTDTIILSGAGNVTAKAAIEKYDLGSAGRTITVPSEVVAAVTIKGGASADTIALSASGATITVDDSTVAVTGGAGADNVTFLNTLALADTLSFDGGIGIDSVVLPAFANTITLTNVETITATAGLTAQTITVAGTSAVALAAGAGVQNILSTNTALTTITDAATTTSIITGVATGTGGYVINTGVLNAAINFSAMTGIAPMTIALNAAGPASITITEATATNTGTTTLTGGATTQTVTVTGGATAHTFTSTASSKINYTAVTAVTAQTITTGAGDDTVAGGGGADSITVGNGINGVTVANKVDLALLVTLVGGTGTDTLTITTPTTAIVDADFSKTAAFDTLVLGATTIATFDTSFKSAGFTSITGSSGIDALTFAGVAPVVSINSGVGADIITVTSTLGSSLTIADTDGIAITGGTGIDAITFSVAPIATTVTGGTGADTIALGALGATITVDDSTMIVTGGAKDDIVTFLNTAAVAAGGAGSLSFIGDTGTDSVTLAAFNSNVTLTNVETITATAALTGNTILITGSSATTVAPGLGAQNITSTSSALTTISAPTAATTSIVTGASTGAYNITADATNLATIDASSSTGSGALTIVAAAKNLAIVESTAATGTVSVSGGNALNIITVTGNATGTAHTFTSTALSKINYTGGSTVQTITTGALADTITGAAGADVIDGGAGDDVFAYTTSAEFLASAAVIDTVTGGSGTADAISITGAIAIAIGDSMARINTVEKLVSATQSASALAHSIVIPDDTKLSSIRTIDLSADTHASSTSTVTLTGVTVAMSVTGVAGADALTGGSAADTISTGGGADVIVGAAGSDTLTGGEGADTITGGTDNDAIVLTETTSAVDKVVFSGGTVAAGAAPTAHLTANGADVITGFASATDTINVAALGDGTTSATGLTPITAAASKGALADDIVSIISTTGAAANLTTLGTLTVSDWTNMSQVSAYLNERYTVTSSANRDVIIINNTAGSNDTSYVYTLSNSVADTTIDTADIVLVGTITHTAGTALASSNVVYS